jgi:hypothetical protein
VKWGEEKEYQVLSQWILATGLPTTFRVIKSRAFQDFDYLILTKEGMPHCYLEIKVRRQSLKMFNDAIFPTRKHDFAKKLRDEHHINFLAVVQYPDALVEVDLASEPESIRDLQRSDRAKAVSHAFYGRQQMTVLREETAREDEDDVAI